MSRHWPTNRLGDVLHLSDNAVPSTQLDEINLAGVYSFGRGLFKRGPMSPQDTSYKTYNRLVADDYVISQPKAWEGALARVTPEFEGWFLSPVFPTFRANQERLLPTYLEWFCKRESVWLELQRNSRGIGARRESVLPEQFLSLEIPLPPLAEQRRIVARIEELAAQIQEARALRHETADEVNYLFEATVSRYLANPSSPRYPLDSRASKIGSGSTPLGGRSAYPSAGIPFVRSLNVRMRTFQWDDIAFISPETHAKMAGTTVKPNDVLLNITGASIGRVACAPPDLREANVNQHVAIIRPDAGLDSRYLMYWLSQPTVQETINSEQKGATRQGFTKAQISAFEVPIPPISEQRRIVAELDTLQSEVDALKHHQRDTAAELDALLPAILDRAFRREL